MARTTGTTAADAAAALEVAKAIDACPATRDALARGALSLTQAREITRAEAAAPGVEVELVDLATSGDIKSLRDKARSLRLKAVDVKVLRARQLAAREVRHWTDELGMVRLNAALTPDIGVPLVNRLEAETARVRRAARREGSTEPYAAHAADALAKMLAGNGQPSSTKLDMVVVCDARAYRRGDAEEGEVVSILGGGPIPVDLAKELSKNASWKAVIHDGVQIHTVKDFGRHIPAEIRTALELGDPPDFEGRVCCEPGCGRKASLEIDHVMPRAAHGPTALANLKFRCCVDHWDKTERDRKAGLLAPRDEEPP